MRPARLGGVVFLPDDEKDLLRQVPSGLVEIGSKLRDHGHGEMIVPRRDTSHDFGWNLRRNEFFAGSVALAAFHPNGIEDFFDSYPLRWYLANGYLKRRGETSASQLRTLAIRARNCADEMMMMGVIGITQLVAGGAAVLLFSGGRIEDDDSNLDTITEQLAKIDILRNREFFAFQQTIRGAEMLDRFDWNRFFKEWPDLSLAACERHEVDLPETLIAFDILLQGYLAVRSEQASWHELRAEFGLAPSSDLLGDARSDTATTSLFQGVDTANRSCWFDLLSGESEGAGSLFSRDLDYRLETGSAADLPTSAKEKFKRCLLSGSSLSAAQALAAALTTSRTTSEAIKILAEHDGGAFRLAYELSRGRGQAFGWTAVATSQMDEDNFSSILLALFEEAHQELVDCREAIEGTVPPRWSEGGK